jgi:hypothetical protein
MISEAGSVSRPVGGRPRSGCGMLVTNRVMITFGRYIRK